MLKRSTLLHLRIPFSYFLMPIFFFALAVSSQINWLQTILAFFILHFLVYPASNGYNSYFDKDEESIGGLKNPPKVSPELYYVALLMDALALLLALIISPAFAVMVFIYGIVSKAYSHPAVRLKKYPITSWLTAGFFQGMFTFLMVYLAVNNVPVRSLADQEILLPAFVSTLMLLGFYPLTQVYQHREDAKRGDLTISRLLGIRGTFYFSASMFLLADAGFFFYFYHLNQTFYFLLLQIFFLPIVLFFSFWFYKILRNEKEASYEWTMRMNLAGSTCLMGFFITLLFLN
ncbi:MAG: UbiA family prenyltransferase [Bacteroidia bacterium]